MLSAVRVNLGQDDDPSFNSGSRARVALRTSRETNYTVPFDYGL